MLDAALLSLVPDSIASLSALVLSTNALHVQLCGADLPDDAAISAVLGAYVRTLTQLARVPSESSADLADKAVALETCVLRYRDEPAAVSGDFGLGASLIADVRRLAGRMLSLFSPMVAAAAAAAMVESVLDVANAVPNLA